MNDDICSRKSLLLFESETFKQKVKENGKEIDEYINEISKKISTSVYDFLYLNDENIKEQEKIIMKVM